MQRRLEVREPNQISAMIHPIRKEILRHLAQGASTPSEVARMMGIAASKVHYHVRILEKAGLITLIDTRQVGSVKELYFEPVAMEMIIRPETGDNESLDLVYQGLSQDLQLLLNDLKRCADTNATSEGTREGSLLSHLLLSADQGGKRLLEETLSLLTEQFDRAARDYPGQEHRLFVGFVRSTAKHHLEKSEQREDECDGIV